MSIRNVPYLIALSLLLRSLHLALTYYSALLATDELQELIWMTFEMMEPGCPPRGMKISQYE